MTAKEFNQSVEKFEINMLEMSADKRFDVLMKLTRVRHELTGRVYNITDLMVILKHLNESYIHLALCRLLCNMLFIYDN